MVTTNDRRITLDGSVLREDYLPQDLTARRTQLGLIEACLEPMRQGRQPTHVWLQGTPGTGKTAAVRTILARFERQAGVHVVVVNCWERDSLYEILDQIVTDLRVFHAEQHRSTVKLDKLQRHLSDRRAIILLDEIDKMPTNERSRALYSLSGLSNTGLVCISTTLDALFDLEDRVRSRIDPRTVAFVPYSVDEIREILTQRAHLALASGACPAYLIKRIAAVCGGDARIAIQTLRKAAESAEQAHRDTIIPKDLVAGWRGDSQSKAARVLARLTEDHRMLHRIASGREPMLSTDLRRAYVRQCRRLDRTPVAIRTFSKYVNQLVRLGPLQCERARVKGNVRLLRACK